MKPIQLHASSACGAIRCSGASLSPAPKALPIRIPVPSSERVLRSRSHHRNVSCHVAQPSEPLAMSPCDSSVKPSPPARSSSSKARAVANSETEGAAPYAGANKSGSDSKSGARAADTKADEQASKPAAPVSCADRQALAFAREYELEIQEEEVDSTFGGRMGQTDFFGPAGRVGSFSLCTYPRYRLRRRQRLAKLRKQLDEAQLMKPIIVGEARSGVQNSVQPAEGLRYDAGNSSSSSPDSSSSAKGEGRGSRGSVSDEGRTKVAATATVCTESGTASSAVAPAHEAAAAAPAVKGAGNVVDFPKSGRVSPGYAVRCPQGVVLPILPKIMAVTGPMGIKEMEALASQQVLSSVLTLELPRQLHSVSLEKDPKHCKRSIQFKAAALARLLARAEQRHGPSYMILLQSRNPTLQPVAQLIAAWLHWRGHMSIQEACDRAGALCGCYVPRSLIEKANEHLYESALSRRRAQYLVWPHGAHHSARVAGDIVGSWQTPVDMHLVTSDETELLGLNEGDWVLRLPDDLTPGLYRYKYVVDGNWRVDWSQPFKDDGHSFCNNLFEKCSNEPLQAQVPESKLGVIRKEFSAMALRVKLALGPKLLGR